MANNQQNSHELIFFYKKNIILHLFLRNLEIFVTFAGKVQYNTLLDMKIQEVMKKSWISLAWRLNMRFVKPLKYSRIREKLFFFGR